VPIPQKEETKITEEGKDITGTTTGEKYKPSIVAGERDITAKKPKETTGIEVRPLIKKDKKNKKKDRFKSTIKT